MFGSVIFINVFKIGPDRSVQPVHPETETDTGPDWHKKPLVIRTGLKTGKIALNQV